MPFKFQSLCCFIVAAYCVISNSSWLQRRSGRNCWVVGSAVNVEQRKRPLSDGNATACLVWKWFVSPFFIFFCLPSDWFVTLIRQIKTHKAGTRCQAWPPQSFAHVFFRAQCVYVSVCMCARFTFNGFCGSEWEPPKWQREQHRNRSYFWFLCFFLINQSNISGLRIIRPFSILAKLICVRCV